MRCLLLSGLFVAASLLSLGQARQPYTAPKSGRSLLDFIKSDPNLSTLAKVLELPPGFAQAFDTVPQANNFTFFAPNNAAFDNLSQNVKKYYLSLSNDGRAWLGNNLLYHYVPVDMLKTNSSAFSSQLQRVQTASFAYLATQKLDEGFLLNRRVRIVEPDISVGGGVVHIVDNVLDPTGLYFDDELSIPKIKQTVIAGWELKY